MGRAKRTLVVVAFTLVSCSSQIGPAATPTTPVTALRVYTTTAAVPLINSLTSSYNQAHANVTFDMQTGNYAAIAERVMLEADAYFFSNHLPIDSPLWAAPVGQDGVTIIVHPENRLADVTIEQLRDIYQGRITNWAEIGGADVDIVVLSRENGSGTRAEFENLVMGDRRTTRLAQVAPSTAAMLVSVARQPGSIGYASLGSLNETVRALAIDGVEPTLENVFDNRYPLRSTLFFIGRQEPQTEMRAFIGWVQSLEGQAVVARHYAPLLRP